MPLVDRTVTMHWQGRAVPLQALCGGRGARLTGRLQPSQARLHMFTVPFTGLTCPHGRPSVALANAASPHANNVLSLRLGQTTTQDGVRGLALRQASV